MDDTHHSSDETIQLQRGIDRLNSGDASVRGELMNLACNQLMRLTGQLKQEFDRLGASNLLEKPLEEIFAGVSARLYQALHDAVIKDTRHFYQLASLHIRRELVDICGQGGSSSCQELRQLAQFHDCVDELSSDQREVFELIWYHEMSREEVSDLLGIPLSSVRRLWRSARLALHDRLDNDPVDGGSGTNFAGD